MKTDGRRKRHNEGVCIGIHVERTKVKNISRLGKGRNEANCVE